MILDSDLALLYGVTTKVLNQAVKRNQARFPADFAFVLTTQEAVDLRSQFVTSSSTDREVSPSHLKKPSPHWRELNWQSY